MIVKASRLAEGEVKSPPTVCGGVQDGVELAGEVNDEELELLAAAEELLLDEL
jgi:hypothetical protein